MRSWVISHKGIINTVLLLLIILCFGMLVVNYPKAQESAKAIVFTSIPLPAFGKELYADISGAVVNPGLYRISEDTRVAGLIQAAGGLALDADLAYVAKDLNLAKILADQDKIYIPFKSQSQATVAESESGRVSISSATAEELEELPGIGPSTAEAIIQNRPYTSIDELEKIPGIGTAKLAQLKPLVRL